MPEATYQVLLDTAQTQFNTDLIALGLSAKDQIAAYDITADVIEATIRRGRRHELEQFGTGSMSLLMRNDDGKYTPDRSNALGGYLNPGAKIKKRATYDDIIAWYDLEEATGATRLDSFGRNHLTSTGGVVQATGQIGFAAEFDGSTQVLTVASNSTLQPARSFSIVSWVRLASKPATAAIAAKWISAGNNKQWALLYNSTDVFRLFITHNGTTQASVDATTFGSPSLATWYMVAGVYDSEAGLIKISVNGGAFDTTAHTLGVFSSGTAPFSLGALSNLSTPLFGRVDSVIYYRRALSSSEITQLYNSGTGVNFSTKPIWAGATYDLFTGYVERITPQLDDSNQTATIEAVDLSARLDNVLVTSPLLQSKTTGELIRRVLSDSMSVRIDQTDIDAGLDTVTYAWFSSENALDALRGVEASEFGQFFVDGRGYPVFTDRNARGTAAASGGVAITSGSIIGADAKRDLADVFNEVRIFAHPRIANRAAVQIWKLRQTLTLLSGASQAIYAEYTDPDTLDATPAINVITPVATVDYAANDTVNGGQVTSIAVGIAGSGYDLNKPPRVFISGGSGYGAEAVAQISESGTLEAVDIVSGGGGYASNPTVGIDVSPTGGANATATATVTVGTNKTTSLSVTTQFRDLGREAYIVVTNNDAGTVYVPLLRLRGDPLMEPNTAPAVASDGASQSFYQKRTQDIDLPWQQSTTTAETLAATLLGRHKDPSTTVRIKLANLSTYDLSVIIGAELNQAIELSLERAGISGTFFIGGLEHTISDSGLIHTLSLDLERSRADGTGLYGSGIYDTTKFA